MITTTTRRIFPGREAWLASVNDLSTYIERLEADLAECFRLSGADPDCNEDWRLAHYAVEEVRRLREEHDADTEAIVKYEEFMAKL